MQFWNELRWVHGWDSWSIGVNQFNVGFSWTMWGDPHMDLLCARLWEKIVFCTCLVPVNSGPSHRTSLNASLPEKAIHHMASVTPGRVGPLAQHAASCIAAGVLGSAPTIWFVIEMLFWKGWKLEIICSRCWLRQSYNLIHLYRVTSGGPWPIGIWETLLVQV